jgi:hypothetical protein
VTPRHGLILAIAAVVLTAVDAGAALTTTKCLASKRKIWGTFRTCEAAARAKLLEGKPADPAVCTTKRDERLAKLDVKASKAAVRCRFGDNGDGTVIDYDTGLQWERKTGVVGVTCGANEEHCVNHTYRQYIEMADFVARMNGGTLSASMPAEAPFASQRDWRSPTLDEVRGIVDLDVPGCGAALACIDPTFGPTQPDEHCTAINDAATSEDAWYVSFADGVATSTKRLEHCAVRLVRSGL